MTEERLITVAIHTYDRAVALKTLLEREGVIAVLHNVNLSTPVVSSGVRVRIRECDLPRALTIIENEEIFSSRDDRTPGKRTILCPIDFSDYSLRAIPLAFDFAQRVNARVLLLHSFINPAITRSVQLTDALSFDLAESQELENKLKVEAEHKLEDLENSLRKRIKDGELPPVSFSGEVVEGVPEDVINDKAKQIVPALIVMGTRGADRKNQELIGSVTAEILDTCRYNVFSLPESTNISSGAEVNDILLFSNLEQEDFLALDALHRLFAGVKLNVTIAAITGKKERQGVSRQANNLISYCKNQYPETTFAIEPLRLSQLADDFKDIKSRHKISLIALPNKKRNAFIRLFNPSLAHKLLLHADIPMVVIPV